MKTYESSIPIRSNESKSIFNVHQRFLRSIHLERDWIDPEALTGYIVTPLVEQSLQRLASGLKPSSGQRAWRITGDYGSGKSSFALLLANLFSNRRLLLPGDLQSSIQKVLPELFQETSPVLWPVLVTGTREPLREALFKGLINCLDVEEQNSEFLLEMKHASRIKSVLTDSFLFEWIQKVNHYIIQTKQGDGILLVLDELGKFLEFAASYPDEQDVYLLQGIAEMAARSKKMAFYVVGCLHQGVSHYAETLPKPQQREWEKVAGRYEEITWHFPVEQVAILIANTLNTRLERVNPSILKSARKDMDQCLSLGWYGLGTDKKLLSQIAERLYPLHPTVIPVLARLFSNLGQNERSLYTFLLGTEQNGLQDFVLRTDGSKIYRLHHLFDYAKTNFGGKLASANFHWKAIHDSINAYVKGLTSELNLLKTVGLLNVLNADDLVPTKEVLTLALPLGSKTDSVFSELHTSQILFNRGRAEGYCLWSNNSVNLESAYEQAKKALGSTVQLNLLIRDRLDPRPVVARRHYIRTGNLRYFEVRYIEVADLKKEFLLTGTADGRILVPLCKNAKEVKQAVVVSESLSDTDVINVLIIIPQPLQELQYYLEELQKWQWIERSVGELRQDRFAREEVSRQITLAQQELDEQLQLAIGFIDTNTQKRLKCYFNGEELKEVYAGRSLMQLLTRLCDDIYHASPCIHNELINRKHISTAGSLGRIKLLQRLFEFADKPYLGMDPEKHPPEMSIYLSLLMESGFHQLINNEGNWAITLPEEAYDSTHSKILPSINQIHSLLIQQEDTRVSVLQVIEKLKKPPYGLQDGIIPIILAIFIVIHEQEIAYYEDGNFTSRMVWTIFLRLMKAPETFEIQYYPIAGVRNELFHRLAEKLNFSLGKQNRVELLDVIKPLMVFMGQLPEYVLKTSSLSSRAQTVRAVLTKTTDPIQLLFNDLPQACGLPAIIKSEVEQKELIEQFAIALKEVIDELRSAYSLLLKHFQTILFESFALSENLDLNRQHLAQRAGSMSKSVTEIGLKSFCLKLADAALPEKSWLESLGNLICSMPPHRWKDADKIKFEQEIHNLTQKFLRVEALLYEKTTESLNNNSVRVALTHSDGEEKNRVVHLSPKQLNQVQALEKQLTTILKSQGQAGIAAASNVLWKLI